MKSSSGEDGSSISIILKNESFVKDYYQRTKESFSSLISNILEVK